jgi:hypothetical protein
MRACAVAPACVASARRTRVVFRHQVSRPACAAPAQLRVPRRVGAVAVRASGGPDARERQLADEAEASGLSPAGLSLAAVLASPLLFATQARVSDTRGRRMTSLCAVLWRRLARCGPRSA